MATVLVADDSASIRLLLRQALTGHDVFEAADGDEALELLTRYQPDIAFLDVMMPALTGDLVCRAARQDPALEATRIVLMSAHARPDTDLNISETGADLFLRKPF